MRCASAISRLFVSIKYFCLALWCVQPSVFLLWFSLLFFLLVASSIVVRHLHYMPNIMLFCFCFAIVFTRPRYEYFHISCVHYAQFIVALEVSITIDMLDLDCPTPLFQCSSMLFSINRCFLQSDFELRCRSVGVIICNLSVASFFVSLAKRSFCFCYLLDPY